MAITLGGSYVTSGLVLHLDSRNTSSYPGTGTLWTDLVGSGINATLVGSPTYNGAINLNGSSQYAIIADNTTLNSQSITMESWCMLTNTVQDGFIFEKGVVNTQYSMFFEQGGGTFIFRTQGLSNTDINFKASYITINTWTHIVCTYSSGVKSIYVNGVLVSQLTGITGTIPTTATGSSIGVYGGYSGARAYYFNGSISLVRVYNRALSQSEINQNFSSTGLTFSNSAYQATKFDSANDAGGIINITSFTANGTWTKPAGCTSILVKLVAGGGGAAGYCESGGGGGYSEKVIDVTSVATVAVTVGSGGASVGYYASGASGGTSSFGSYCTASGGGGSNTGGSHCGGNPGLGSGGNINLYGGVGTGHANHSGHYPGGTGGGTFFGSSGTVNRATTSNKLYSGAPGTGGPGGRTNDGGGGAGIANGENGLIIVYAYK